MTKGVDNGIDTIQIARCNWIGIGRGEERYLTHEEKERVIDVFETRLKQYASYPKEDRGGIGTFDPPIRSLVDRLNAIEGVCTVQSCAGHPSNDYHGKLAGQVWLRLSEEMSQRFQARVAELCALRNIYLVATRYLSRFDDDYPIEVVWIAFETWTGIAAFFEDLATEELMMT